uniref:Extensin-like n=1 Tax=Mesocestoides corti TaxID=53468 RepID=A0A5K3FF50_MESCO
MRSFTLCEKTQSDFYVLSDIFRYQDRVYIPEPNDTNPSPESKKSAPEKKINAKPNGVAHTQKQQWQRPQPQEKKHDVPSPPVTNSVEQEPRKVESPAPRSITPKAKLDESHHPIEQPVMPDPVPQPSTAAPMSWAQRASGIAAASSTASHMPQPQPPQSTKPISNPESVPASTGSQRNSHKSQRGPRQQQADTRRDSNSDRSDVSGLKFNAIKLLVIFRNPLAVCLILNLGHW